MNMFITVRPNVSEHTSDAVAVSPTDNAPSDFFHLRRDQGPRHKKREVNEEVKKIICYHCQHDPDGNKNADCLDPFWEHDIPVVSCKGTCVVSVDVLRLLLLLMKLMLLLLLMFMLLSSFTSLVDWLIFVCFLKQLATPLAHTNWISS